jgi:hypothetical protein
MKSFETAPSQSSEKAPEEKKKEIFLKLPESANKYFAERYGYEGSFTTGLPEYLRGSYPKLNDEQAETVINRIKNLWTRSGASFETSNLAMTGYESTKFNNKLRKALFQALGDEAEAVLKALSDEDIVKEVGDATLDINIQKAAAFDRFFEPLTKVEEIKRKLEEYKQEKSELSKKLIQINEDRILSKDQRKEQKIPIEVRLTELSKLRKPLEEKIKATDQILFFIPGYQSDYEKFKEDALSKQLVPDAELKEKFNKEWIPKNQEKKLQTLKKSLIKK